ncbi:tartrate dehydrogenase [Helicobacter sp. 12S02232-10]|uniref:tartrate dehydrogenase n=1 Tax=Helicobacter sp. 12S02232-10 TaxID=1476197 RepID=UPI000BA65C18|nr:tartrate dehydrogenase [Helicobacter sp. 12S02232-10]PAF47440.1 tartrate dehydrogenase [Helicobacter sp. 12S02232-10]
MKKEFNIAVIKGDGIGNEVMPEGLKILEYVDSKFGLNLKFKEFDFANCDYYLKHKKMMPDDWFEILKDYDAIYFGAVGMPQIVPDHISLWGSLLKFRRDFDQYINLRPVRLLDGIPCPLAGKRSQDINFVVVRENTEGEYSSVGGKMFEGTPNEFVIQESIFTRRGVDRVLEYAFKLAEKSERKTLTSATKSNGISISMPYWDERTEMMAKSFPNVKYDKQHIDILCARFVLQPERFNIVVASNLFGDILSDLGPACAGTIGVSASANINPQRNFPSLFEPVHGSAPDIFGKNIANPIGMIWSGALMLEFLGEKEPMYQKASKEIIQAIEKVVKEGPKTPDMGGNAKTFEVGDGICAVLKNL